MTLITILFSLQALGALIGVVEVVRAEIAYVWAMRDGTIDAAERVHLAHLARGLRFGMSFLLLASFGLVIVNYTHHTELQSALQGAYWTEMLLALAIIGLSWALSRKRIVFALGSAGVFTAWWFLALLALGQMPALALGSAIAFYILATASIYTLLWYARMLASPRSPHS